MACRLVKMALSSGHFFHSGIITRRPVATIDYPPAPIQLAASSVVGAVTFPAVLGIAQVALFKPLRLTSGARLCSLAGGAAVFVTGFASSCAVVTSYSLSRDVAASNRPASSSIELVFKDLIISGLVSMVVFRALGGRFSMVLPSNLMQPGSFSRYAIPVNEAPHATKSQKMIIQDLGRKHGCHTCGHRSKLIQYRADHQPPTKLVKEGRPQWYHPHCKKCSDLQGAVMNKTGSRVAVVTHPFSLRSYHIFLPVPLALAFMKTHSPSLSRQQHDDVPAIVPTTAPTPPTSSTKTTTATSSTAAESDQQSLIANFPFFIVWQKTLAFLESLHPCGRFHITLWMFSAIAALGCL